MEVSKVKIYRQDKKHPSYSKSFHTKTVTVDMDNTVAFELIKGNTEGAEAVGTGGVIHFRSASFDGSQQSALSIPVPQELNGYSNFRDRLFYDKTIKLEYIITKKHMTGEDLNEAAGNADGNTSRITVKIPSDFDLGLYSSGKPDNLYCDSLPIKPFDEVYNGTPGVTTWGPAQGETPTHLVIGFGNKLTFDEAKAYLDAHPLYIYCVSNTSKIIDTGIKEKPSIDIYKDGTITQESNVFGECFIRDVGLNVISSIYKGNRKIIYGNQEPKFPYIKTTKASSFDLALVANENASVQVECNSIEYTMHLKKNTKTELNLKLPNDNSEKIIKFKGNHDKIATVIANNSSVTKVDVTGMNNLNRLHIHTNPIVTDDTELNALVSSLPDRTLKGYGSIVIGDRTQQLKVEPAMLQKDWTFGSMLQYTEPDKIPYHIKFTGVQDIWDSAEHGEGVNICIVDTMFDLNSTEVDVDRIKGRYNLSRDGMDSDHIQGTSIAHGTEVLSIVMAKGVKMYGVSHKSDFYLARLDHPTSLRMSYESIGDGVRLPFVENKFDIYNMSAGGVYSPDSCMDMFKSVFDSNNGRGTAMLIAAGNEGDNNVNTTDRKSYPASFYGCVSVNAMTEQENMVWFAKSHDRIDLSTYGMHIPVCGTGQDHYYTNNGTSVACPVATGITALLFNILKKKLGRKPTVWETYAELYKRVTPVNLPSLHVGSGKIDVMTYNPNYLVELKKMTGLDYGQSYDKEGSFLVSSSMGFYFYLSFKGEDSHMTIRHKGEGGEGYMGHSYNGNNEATFKVDHHNWTGTDIYTMGNESYVSGFTMDGQYVERLDVSKLINLERISLKDNNFMTKDERVTEFAKTVPDRTGKTAGQLIVDTALPNAEATGILTSKNWTITHS